MTIIKLNLKLLIYAAIFLLQAVSAIGATTINNLRLIEVNNKISMVFDASKSLDYALEQSSGKIAITVKNAKLVALLNKTWLVKTPVVAITSKQSGKNLHLTLKLKNPVKLKHSQLKKPARLVLDFAITNTEVVASQLVHRNQENSTANLKTVKKTVIHEPVSGHDGAARAIVTNEEKIDQIEQQIALQIADRPILSRDNETKAKPQNDSAPVVQEVVNNSSQEFSDTVNIISTGNNASGNRSRDVIIVIDPGHGGKDAGAIGFSGAQEKDINLAVSKYLQKTINTNKGFKAILTRDSDYFIELRERLGIAHRHKADMFVAIHADAYISKTARGVSVFALSQKGATSEAARWLAKKENESELGRNISNKNTSLKSVLIDLAQAATISASLEIGRSLLYGFNQFAHLHSHRVEQAAFVVLKSPDIPSLLVETGFISDPYEESRLRDPEYQQKIASCLASGIVEYFTSRPPRDAYLAKIKR